MFQWQVKFVRRDWGLMFWTAFTQAAIAWFMAAGGMVYAPIPMFTAAVMAGFLFKSRPGHAALAGFLAGLAGGALAEWAFHAVRVQKQFMNWSQLSGSEQFWLSMAEMLLYAAFLSFFAAFVSWGTHREKKTEEKKEQQQSPEMGFNPMESLPEEIPNVELPLFKDESEN